MKRIENIMNGAKGSSRETHKNYPIHYGVWGGIFLKRIITNLPPTKNNKINIFHSDLQNYVSCAR